MSLCQNLFSTTKGSDEFNQVLGDLTYAILENKLGVKDLASAGQDYIEAVLRENGVVNASTTAHNMIKKAKGKGNLYIVGDQKFEGLKKQYIKREQMTR